jgi:Tol biopolymer transport system component
MSAERFLEDEVRALFDATAPSGPPEHLLANVHTAARQRGRHPRWLALVKEPPMRISSRVAVGSPTVRVAALLAATLLIAILGIGAVVAGASLLSDPTEDVNGRNGLIAFDSADGNIYVADADGSDARVLVDRDAELRGPSWSPDGNKLAFFEMVETGPGPLDDTSFVHVVDADGGNDVELTGGRAIVPALYSTRLMSASGLVWSPDSTQVAMTVLGDGSSDSGTGDWLSTVPARMAAIVIAEADGSRIGVLPVEGDAADPMWSPDGRWLAWRGQGQPATIEQTIWVSRADGTSAVGTGVGGSGDFHNMYSNDGAFSSPQWSPAGDRILYYSWDGSTYMTAQEDDWGIYTVDAFGPQVTRPPELLGDHPAHEWWPSWSPDGLRIAFQRVFFDEPKDPEIHVMAADGSDPVQLDVGPGMDGNGPLVWAPDGSAILTFRAEPDAEGRIRTQPTIVSLDPTVPPVVIPDPAGARSEGWSEWVGLTWQRAS